MDLERRVISLLEAQRAPARRDVALGLDAELVDVGLDSLAMVRFWVSCEEALALSLEDLELDFAALRTVGEVVAGVRAALGRG